MESSIHGNPATHKYKLLQLRQHFSREAKNIVEPLGYSAAGYEAGSTETQIWRRGQKKIAFHLEELENIKTVRRGNAGDIEKLQIFWT